jgi:hypothetical protein
VQVHEEGVLLGTEVVPGKLFDILYRANSFDSDACFGVTGKSIGNLFA